MPGVGLITALVLSLFSASPQWPDLMQLPPATGGGEGDAAVVVAVEDYAYLPDVVGAGDLGVAWFLYLSKVRKVPGVMLLQNGDATPIKIRSSLEKAAERVKPGGRVWFVFIGHGSPSQDQKDGALVGAAAQADQYDFFPHTFTRGEVLQRLAPKLGGVLPPVLVIDACFSGTDGDGKTLIAGAQFAVSAELGEANEATGATVLTAGRARDIAGRLPGATRPAFSYLVLGALRGWGDANGDGEVTGYEAVEYARNALLMLDSGRQQSPQASGVDQALTPKTSGNASEPGPDLAAIRVQLTGASGGGGTGEDNAYRAQMDALRRQQEKAKKEAQEAARLEKVAKEQHAVQVDKDWALAQEIAQGGGAEGKMALELFLKRYQDHPFGNPREAEAREMLERFVTNVAAVLDGYVLVEPGCFLMGSPTMDDGGSWDAAQHEVCITRAFYMKETEVTQREWKDVMGVNESKFVSCGDNCPVDGISWWDAVTFANALSEREGLERCYTLSGCTGERPGAGSYKCSGASFSGPSCKGYRLPTEAEWEYAARAGTNTATYAGGPEAKLDAVAWYGGNSGVDYSGADECNKDEQQYGSYRCGTHPVRMKRPNDWGLYDMFGNVWEWCWDWYEKDYYGSSPRNDPLGASSGPYRVHRGGDWWSFQCHLRAAKRDWYHPDLGSCLMGFRLCRSVP